MSLFKPHVAAMKQGFYPALTAVSDALSNPSGLTGPGFITSAFAGLVAWRSALKRLIKASDGLAGHVFAAQTCPSHSQAAFTHEFDSAVLGVIRVYAALRQVEQQEPGPRSGNLARMARGHLETLAMWLADIVLTLGDPESMLDEGGGREFNVRFSLPDTVDELDTFVMAPTGFDRAHLQDALLVAMPLPQIRPSFQTGFYRPAPREPKRNSGLSSFLWGALFGAVLFDWFDDD